MKRAYTAVVLLALAIVVGGAGPAIGAGAEADTPTFTKDVLPILQHVLRSERAHV